MDSLFRRPDDLPRPSDDGGADHLRSVTLPDLSLATTDERIVHLASLHRAVVFIYPRTGVPGMLPGADWDAIPGARGCTPQACAFRDLHEEFRELGADLFGLSTQTSAFQREFVKRNHITFPMLSDSDLLLTQALGLPTFQYDVTSIGGGGPDTLLRRMVWFVETGQIRRVWYPVFPPDQNAADVAQWLRDLAMGSPQ